MAIPLRQSIAGQEIPLGYFVDSTDGDTAETGLTIANTDIKLWKAGATTLADKNSGGGTHISGGIYYAVLDATDTDTLGALLIFVHVAGALAVRLECVVYPANVYDSLFSTDKLQVDVVEISGDSIAADNAELMFDGTGYAGGTARLKVIAESLDTQAKSDVNAEVVDVLRTDTIPDSYAAHEAQPTLSQAVLAILQYLTERSVSGTTVTVKKPDGATTAMTFTLDDGTNPTSHTRTS